MMPIETRTGLSKNQDYLEKIQTRPDSIIQNSDRHYSHIRLFSFLMIPYGHFVHFGNCLILSQILVAFLSLIQFH